MRGWGPARLGPGGEGGQGRATQGAICGSLGCNPEQGRPRCPSWPFPFPRFKKEKSMRKKRSSEGWEGGRNRRFALGYPVKSIPPRRREQCLTEHLLVD